MAEVQKNISTGVRSGVRLPNSVLSRPSWQLFLAFALLIGTVLAYIPSLTGEFQFDDTPVIEKIERQQFSLSQILRGYADNRPLTYLTLLANYEIAGLDVRAYHVTNVLFHLGTVSLTLLFTWVTLERLQWPSSKSMALVVASLFALHPLQTQAVSYVIQRAEVLASFFYLATLLLLLKSERPASRWRALVFYCGAVITFLLGLGAKEIVVTVPFAYVVHRFFAPGRNAPTPWGCVVLRATPLAAIAVYVGLSTVRASEGSVDVGFAVPLLPPWRYLLTQMSVIPTYLRMLVWPAGQNIEHDFPLSQGLWDPRTLLGFMVLAGFVGFALWLFVRSGRMRSARWGCAGRAVPFGITWFFLLLAPTSSIMPLADVMVEHRVYLASWGVFLSVVVAVAAALENMPHAKIRTVAAAALMLLVLSSLFMVTWQRNTVWGSRLALWVDAAKKSPNKARARSNHAHALRMVGRPAEAIGEYLVALSLVGEKPSLLRGLGGAFYEAGRLEEAEDAIRRSLALAPTDSLGLNDLAVYLATEGRFAEAEKMARRAISYDPRNALAYLTLGNVRIEQGDPQGALEALERAEALAPHLGAPTLSVAIGYGRLGDRAAACAALDRYRRVKRETPKVREIARKLECPPGPTRQ